LYHLRCVGLLTRSISFNCPRRVFLPNAVSFPQHGLIDQAFRICPPALTSFLYPPMRTFTGPRFILFPPVQSLYFFRSTQVRPPTLLQVLLDFSFYSCVEDFSLSKFLLTLAPAPPPPPSPYGVWRLTPSIRRVVFPPHCTSTPSQHFPNSFPPLDFWGNLEPLQTFVPSEFPNFPFGVMTGTRLFFHPYSNDHFTFLV